MLFQEFKKEQLKVQISNHGILKITGERPLDASTQTKFYKEVPVPSHKYDTHAIHAKFVNGWLIISIPKEKSSTVPEINEPPKIDQTPKPESTAAAPPPEDGVTGGAKEETPTPGGNASTKCRLQAQKRPTVCLRLAKAAASLAATAAAVVVLVAFVVYMYKSIVVEIDDSPI